MTWLVVGLGNPGPRYERTRHNVGQHVVNHLAEEAGARWTTHRAHALTADLRLGTLPGGAPGPRVLLAKSLGYMNESGRPVAALMRAEGIAVDRLLVIHDELDLPLGKLRLKNSGGEGGHNGLKSISENLGTRNYARLRCGIGRPPGQMDPADYVLSAFGLSERPDAAIMVVEAAEVVQDVLTRGWEPTQQELHSAG